MSTPTTAEGGTMRRQRLPGIAPAMTRRTATAAQRAALVERQMRYDGLICLWCELPIEDDERTKVEWQDGEPLGIAHQHCTDWSGDDWPHDGRRNGNGDE